MKLLLGIDPIRYPLTGIGRYTYELARGMVGNPAFDSCLFFAGTGIQTEFPDPHLRGTALNVADATRSAKLVALKSDVVVEIYRTVRRFRQAWTLNSRKDYVYHGPNYYLPPHSGPCVATFHDLSMFRHPEYHPRERVRFMEKEVRRSVDQAHVLLTDSEYTRREVIEFLGFSADRILAVPLAASPEFQPRDEASCRAFLHRVGLEYQGYVLFAGTVEPRKNIVSLLNAFEALPSELRTRYPLVITGYKGWCSKDVHERMERAQQQGWLRYLGFTQDADLPLLFSAARVFAFPSFYEGFGLPVVEAMASAVPVVCSDASSLPEASGGCALMCAPTDVDGLSRSLQRAIEDTGWRESAILSGLVHARSFSWQRTVQGTLDAYRLACKV